MKGIGKFVHVTLREHYEINKWKFSVTKIRSPALQEKYLSTKQVVIFNLFLNSQTVVCQTELVHLCEGGTIDFVENQCVRGVYILALDKKPTHPSPHIPRYRAESGQKIIVMEKC